MFSFWNNKTAQLFAKTDNEIGYGLKNIEIEILQVNIPEELNLNGLIGWFDGDSYDGMVMNHRGVPHQGGVPRQGAPQQGAPHRGHHGIGTTAEAPRRGHHTERQKRLNDERP